MAQVARNELITRFGTTYGFEEVSAAMQVIMEGAPTDGERVKSFEEEFAKYCGVKHALAVTSGTTALNLGCFAAGVGPGDEVLVPAVTWVATANAATIQGARVRFVDIDPETFNMDPRDLEKKITDRTKLIIPVHLYGQMCEMDSIMEIAEDHDCLVLSDCAHAPGAEYKGKKAGSIADMGAFSFHQQKNMSTLGEGGMLVTDDDELYERARLYRNHGREPHSHVFKMVGHNYRMTDIQAAVGLVQLSKLDSLNAKRISLSRLLTRLLEDVRGVSTPKEAEGCVHVYHLYNILVDPSAIGMDRDTFISELADRYGIVAGKHYSPVHLTEIYRELGSGPGECPTAERLTEVNVTLPIHPRLSESDVRYIADCVSELAGLS